VKYLSIWTRDFLFHFHLFKVTRSLIPCDKLVPVTTARRVLRLRTEERPPVWRVAANILNKQSRTADKGWSFSLGVGRGANNSVPLKPILLRNIHRQILCILCNHCCHSHSTVLLVSPLFRLYTYIIRKCRTNGSFRQPILPIIPFTSRNRVMSSSPGLFDPWRLDRNLSRNVGKQFRVTSQNSENLIYTSVEARNHAFRMETTFIILVWADWETPRKLHSWWPVLGQEIERGNSSKRNRSTNLLYESVGVGTEG
jgi:hypothetical protein